jgi:hypothetical protein
VIGWVSERVGEMMQIVTNCDRNGSEDEGKRRAVSE